MRRRVAVLTALMSVAAVGAAVTPADLAGATTSSRPAPGSAAYVARDVQNMRNAYGRQTAPDGQLTPRYLLALQTQAQNFSVADLLAQAARPTHPAVTPGNLAPGWNVGNPLRAGWNGTRGRILPVTFPNRYGALLVGDVFTPLPGARDPYTGRALHGPYPAVVVTPGSVQGSERMYWWVAEDLAERGYVVLTYDTQGQGRSETLPHQNPEQAPVPDIPFCDPLEPPAQYEETGCPGVPSQQTSNFIVGTEDAITFMLSTPHHTYRGTHNPAWRLIDRRRDRHPFTPGRTTKLAIIGHSLGAVAVSYVQGVDKRVATAVALDKLSSGNGSFGGPGVTQPPTRPVVPALAVQSEYGFAVTPYALSGGSSIAPEPSSPEQAPDPRREEKTGFDAWRAAGVDTMLVVPRASTHLEYTDIPLALPASRYGQDVASHYVQTWLDKYLKHDPTADRRLLAPAFTYLEPKGSRRWAPVRLVRSRRLSFYYCSGYSLRPLGARPRRTNLDWSHVGC
jgi:dienelactone hydrolase